ncbi:MAG: 4-hydroxy-tetrahydrodipicolinate synthase [Polyangiaceae bacterium]
MTAAPFEGTYTALVTPFREDQSIDWDAFDALLEAQIAGGVKGLVPCGTTGESPTLSHEEQLAVISRTVKRAGKRAHIVAGCGSNSTLEAIHLSREAHRSGADAVMIVVPYYNRPTQDGLVAHYVAIAREVPCPVVVYNVPARTASDLLPDALGRILDSAPNVVAVKEATGNVLRAQELVRRFGTRLAVLSGDDALTLPMIASGARGVISVTSNLLPAAVARATELALTGDRDAARRAHLALLPVHEAMFVESNPAPVKAGLAAKGAMRDVVRGPLVAASQKARDTIAAALTSWEKSPEAGRG